MSGTMTVAPGQRRRGLGGGDTSGCSHLHGISGVATNTSFALFLLHSLFTSDAALERLADAKALLYGVKREDLSSSTGRTATRT
jgi:hypothetical protein